MICLEGDLGSPDMSYGWAKLTGEYLAKLAHERHGLNVTVYRPFSGYGEDQDHAYPMPAIVARALRHAAHLPFEVWGSGHQRRDFVHIDDCVRCVMATYPQIQDGSALNISTGNGVCFLDLAELVLSKAGLSCSITARPDRPEGVFARVGDTALQRGFGFSASVSLEDGVERMINALAEARPKAASDICA